MMQNIPQVKLGIIAVSRDCFPIQLSESRRAAIAKGAAASALFDIPARERIGRAKSVPEAEYPMVYEAIRKDMADQIDAAAAKGGEF